MFGNFLACACCATYDFRVQNRTRPPRYRRAARAWTSTLAISGLMLIALVPAASAAAPAAHAARATAARSIRVGSVKLAKCGTAPVVYCGSLKVPLDYSS